MIRHHVREFGHNKIMAIKLVRELTNSGLKEAKDLVEQHAGFFVTADAQTLERVAVEARRWNIWFDPPLDALTPTLAGTGGAGHHAVRFVSGPQLIQAIKLVRELTGLGLREAKDLVERGGLVRTELSRGEAEAIVRQFAEIGAHAEVIEGSGSGKAPPPSKHDFEKEDDYDF